MERRPEQRKKVKGGVKRSETESEAALDCMSSGGRSERRRRGRGKFSLVSRSVFCLFAFAHRNRIAAIQRKGFENGRTALYKHNLRLSGTGERPGGYFFRGAAFENQLRLAADNGKELLLTPIGREAFVFFVKRENPLDGLSS
jgi:hypothetical protein